MKVEIPDNIMKMAIEMKRLYDARENMSTARPLFCVYEKKRIIIPDDICGVDNVLGDVDQRDLYVLESSGEYFDFLSMEEMKEFAEENDVELEEEKYCTIFKKYIKENKYKIYNSHNISIFQAAFFTGNAAEGWKKSNLHNLNSPFVFVHSAQHMSKGWQEMEILYDFLIGIAETQGEENEN